MCKVINFNENRRNMAVRRINRTAKALGIGQRNSGNEKAAMEWLQEYVRERWSISKLMCRIIEHYGYICCNRKRKYVFEDIKRDVKYCEMYPEIENKRYKAPLWVKVKGEWCFIEVYADSASIRSFDKKWCELGNYGIKGFLVELSGLKPTEMKRMIEDHDLDGIAEKVKHAYDDAFNSEIGDTECKCSVSFGGEKKERKCSYKLLELKQNEYAILEGKDQETGDKHFVLLCGGSESKEYAKYYREQYGDAGLPLLYGQWEPQEENWKACITKKNRLYKRLMGN